jgi:uncharacterized protein (TIGR02246 family)
MALVLKAAARPADIVTRFEAAWNAHDMDAFAQIFEPEATFVSRFGHVWRGQDEIVERHRRIHDTIYRECRIANELLRLDDLAEDVSVGVVRSLITVGRFMPTGPRQFSSIFTYVAHRGEEGWRIRTGANVACADPQSGNLIVGAPA